MLRNATILLATVFATLAFGTSAHAQGFGPAGPNYNPFGGPALNPHLNLLRGGDPAANYYLGVVPERFNRASLGAIMNRGNYGGGFRNLDIRGGDGYGDDLPRPSPGGEDLIDIPLATTGHATFFNNTAGYFGGRSGGLLQNPAQNRLRNINQQANQQQNQQAPRP